MQKEHKELLIYVGIKIYNIQFILMELLGIIGVLKEIIIESQELEHNKDILNIDGMNLEDF